MIRTMMKLDHSALCRLLLLLCLCVSTSLCSCISKLTSANALPSTPSPPNPDLPKAIGGVATDSEQCSQVGRDILKQDGSAVDSAIASLLCLGVVNGQSSGLGGGFQMVIYTKSTGAAEALSGHMTAYGTTYPGVFDVTDPAIDTSVVAKNGMLAVAVPGELSGMWKAHQRYGKLPWKDVFAPAIDLARNGFEVADHLDRRLGGLTKDKYPELWAMYWNEERNRRVRLGETMTRPTLANTLEAIAENGVDEFYKGATAVNLIHDIQERGGNMTLEDLANYEAVWTEAETLEEFSPASYSVYSTQNPSNGPLLLFMLRALDGFDIPSSDNMTLEERITFYHRYIEVTKFGFGIRAALGDTWAPNLEQSLENLRSPAFAAHIRSLIEAAGGRVTYPSTKKYRDFSNFDDDFEEFDGDTSHISVLAPNGDAVSVTTSIGSYFGCKDVSPSTGLLLNNYMRNFDFEGKFIYWKFPNNHPAPGKRPLTSMGPSITVDQNGDVKLIVGASGAMRIIPANFWVIIRTLLMNVPLEQAIDEPRMYNFCMVNTAYYEEGFQEQMFDVAEMEARGHRVGLSKSILYATVQGILRDGDQVYAHSDPRKGGKAALVYPTS